MNPAVWANMSKSEQDAYRETLKNLGGSSEEIEMNPTIWAGMSESEKMHLEQI